MKKFFILLLYYLPLLFLPLVKAPIGMMLLQQVQVNQLVHHLRKKNS